MSSETLVNFEQRKRVALMEGGKKNKKKNQP